MGIRNLLTGAITFEEWISIGIHNNWCGPIICHTCDGLPTSQHEDTLLATYERNPDTCIHILRLYRDEVNRITIEDNHPPSRLIPFEEH